MSPVLSASRLHRSCMAGLFVVSVLLLAGCSSEASDWRDATMFHSKASYQRYLERRPEGEHAEEAREWLLYFAAREDDREENWKQLFAKLRTEPVRKAAQHHLGTFDGKRVEEFLLGLAPIVQGNLMLGQPTSAAPYEKKPGIHPMVAVDGHAPIKPAFHPWNSRFPAEWRTTTFGKLELVVILTEVDQKVGELEYEGEKGSGPVRKIPQIRRDMKVEVREARTAKTVASKTFQGTPPPAPEELRIYLKSHPVTEFRGELPSQEAVQAWLQPIIEGKQ